LNAPAIRAVWSSGQAVTVRGLSATAERALCGGQCVGVGVGFGRFRRRLSLDVERVRGGPGPELPFRRWKRRFGRWEVNRGTSGMFWRRFGGVGKDLVWNRASGLGLLQLCSFRRAELRRFPGRGKRPEVQFNRQPFVWEPPPG
jgi:hypothetical protein